MKKLSVSQRDVLTMAHTYRYNIYHRFPYQQGWFLPLYHDCAPVIARHQTCKSLCGLGLMEYRTIDYVKRGGEWFPVNEYRINDEGTQYIEGVGSGQ